MRVDCTRSKAIKERISRSKLKENQSNEELYRCAMVKSRKEGHKQYKFNDVMDFWLPTKLY